MPLPPRRRVGLPSKDVRREHNESGAGVVTMGITAVLVLLILLIATQTMVVLQRQSIVAAAAGDIADQAAQDPLYSDQQADEFAQQLLGDSKADAIISRNSDSVTVLVKATSPSVLRGPLAPLTNVDRSATRRIETFRKNTP
jgi:Na+-transporting methylmalonyl-CoA/oxaloacetate decarboxylase gamma subunit